MKKYEGIFFIVQMLIFALLYMLLIYNGEIIAGTILLVGSEIICELRRK